MNVRGGGLFSFSRRYRFLSAENVRGGLGDRLTGGGSRSLSRSLSLSLSLKLDPT
jgi:hypothetical protein